VWTSSPVTGTNGAYTIQVCPILLPNQGRTAFFAELTFPGPENAPLVFTTEVVVTPDFYPFPSPWAAPLPVRRGR
jgi:hypothetical protein